MRHLFWRSADAGAEAAAEADFTDGIKRMMNNRNLYVRLLGKFQKADSLSALRAAVAENNPEKVRHEAHTLKGVAANLGLVGLASKAASLDDTIRGGHPEHISELMERIEASYAKTMAEIMAYVGEV